MNLLMVGLGEYGPLAMTSAMMCSGWCVSTIRLDEVVHISGVPVFEFSVRVEFLSRGRNQGKKDSKGRFCLLVRVQVVLNT